MPELLFHVDHVKCGGCASTIRHRLEELAGVTGVWVDTEAGTVRVAHDGSTEHDEAAAVLRRLGYPVNGTGGVMELAKSYVSCAIGRVRYED